MRVYEDAPYKQGINFLKLRICETAKTREDRMRGYQSSHSADCSGYAEDLDIEKSFVLFH